MARGILFEDNEIDSLRAVLGAVYSYLRGVDMTESQRQILPAVKESPLTEAVREVLTGIEEKQGRFELLRRDGREPEYAPLEIDATGDDEDEDDEGDFLDDEDDDD